MLFWAVSHCASASAVQRPTAISTRSASRAASAALVEVARDCSGCAFEPAAEIDGPHDLGSGRRELRRQRVHSQLAGEIPVRGCQPLLAGVDHQPMDQLQGQPARDQQATKVRHSRISSAVPGRSGHRHKRAVIANTAVTRELAGWCWSLAVLDG